MALISPSGRWLKVNQALCKMLGYAEEDFLSTGVHEFTHPEDFDSDVAQMLRLINQEISQYDVRKRYIARDGEEVPVILNLSMVRLPSGEAEYYVAQIQSVAQYEIVNRPNHLDDELLDSLMSTSPDHIYFKDHESRFIRINAAFTERHGFTDDSEAIGKTDFDLFNEQHAALAYADEKRIMDTGVPVIGKEENPIWPDGRVCWVSSTKVPRRDKDGKIIGIIGISRDITDRKVAELEQDRLQRQVVDLSRRAGMSEIAASVLHNVGNVLNSVNVSSSVLADKVRELKINSIAKTAQIIKDNSSNLGEYFSENPQGKQLPEFLEKLATRLAGEQVSILEELDLLARNIDHIAQIIKVQQSYANVGGMQEHLDIGELVEDALRMNASMFMRHHMELVREFEVMPKIWAEKHKILQILVNLIRNAKHALTDGGVEPKRLIIRIESQNNESVAISIKDNGIGIKPENLKRVFEYGFTTKSDGHGFGLHGGAITAQELGGSLTVHSEGQGMGATFTLEIPLNSEAANRAV